MRDMEELIGYYYDALNKYQAVKEIENKQPSDNKLLVYNSPQMSDLIRVMNNVASTDANILIQGESGTGKEVLAEYIHEMSERKDKEDGAHQLCLPSRRHCWNQSFLVTKKALLPALWAVGKKA